MLLSRMRRQWQALQLFIKQTSLKLSISKRAFEKAAFRPGVLFKLKLKDLSLIALDLSVRAFPNRLRMVCLIEQPCRIFRSRKPVP